MFVALVIGFHFHQDFCFEKYNHKYVPALLWRWKMKRKEKYEKEKFLITERNPKKEALPECLPPKKSTCNSINKYNEFVFNFIICVHII